MDWFKLTYELLGGLAIFFFGMKMFSDGLQTASSSLIKKVINHLTTNRVIAVAVGLVVTCIVQSSSITTVMVVGFVNAGLMQLTQAIGVVLGANIGTTITGWIISIKVGKYSFVFLALGILPLIASKNSKVAATGRVLFALGMVFLGLSVMSGAFKPLRTHDGFIELMTVFAADNYISVLATVGVGCLLTFLIQSSSAMLGITIALASTGSISFQTALALVLGENIGTTITAILAGLGSNIHGKRAAAAHAMFNVLGVVVMVILFPVYYRFIEWMVATPADFVAADGSKPNIAVHIAAGHSIFNVANALLFLPFLGRFAALIQWMFPIREKQQKHLEHLGTDMTMSPGIAIVQAQKALLKMADMVNNMVEWTREYVCDKPTDKLRQTLLRYESVTDKIHQEIMIFVGHVMTANLSAIEAKQINGILSVSDELESLADYCQKIVNQTRHTERPGEHLDEEAIKMIDELMNIAEIYYKIVHRSLKDEVPLDEEKLEKIRADFNEKALAARSAQLSLVRSGKTAPITSLTVNDIVGSLGRVVSHSRKVAEAHVGRSFVEVFD